MEINLVQEYREYLAGCLAFAKYTKENPFYCPDEAYVPNSEVPVGFSHYIDTGATVNWAHRLTETQVRDEAPAHFASYWASVGESWGRDEDLSPTYNCYFVNGI